MDYYTLKTYQMKRENLTFLKKLKSLRIDSEDLSPCIVDIILAPHTYVC